VTITKNLSVGNDGFVTPPDVDVTPEPSGHRHLLRRVRNGDVELHAESLLQADSGRAPVILLSDAEAPSTRWPTELRRGLAAESGGVIWFDTRDCGRSSWLDEPYEMPDLVSDVLAVLQAFDVAEAHVFGRGMGGVIAQHLALVAPAEVRSLTLFSTSPGRREIFGLPEDWLVEKMSERLFADPPVDPVDQVEWIAQQQEWFAGPVFGFDRDRALQAAAQEVATGFRGPNHHGHALVEAADIVDDLNRVRAPTLVVHGTADPVYPVAHGQGLAERVPNAELVLIEGLGHELPRPFIPQLLDLMRGFLQV